VSFSSLIGQACLSGAVATSFLQATRSHSRKWSYVTLGLVATAFGILMWAHVTSNFSYLNVIQHSHTLKPLIYKISGVWANHEGSMLMWTLFLCAYNGLAAFILPKTLKAPVGRILACLTIGFLLFIILVSDPFVTVLMPPLDGEDLNPLLQDPSLIIHPPILYLGQVGCSIPFALCLIVLLKKDFTPLAIRYLRIFTLTAWAFLTAGLALGSFWAYYELGWGGWWFWDPVESLALLPWLSMTALFHCLIMAEKQQTLKRTSLFLGILSFGFCLFGLFLVRSGLLTSVHSFAVDVEKGYFLFVLFILFFASSVSLWAVRYPCFTTNPLQTFSQANLIALNVVLLLSGALTIVFATLYPLVLGGNFTIDASYFKITFIPLMLPLLFLMGLGIWMCKIPKQLLSVGCLGLFSVLMSYWILPEASLLACLMVGASVWVMGSSLFYLSRRPKTLKTFGVGISHFGVGLMVFGMVFSVQGSLEKDVFLKKGESFDFAGYTFTAKSLDEIRAPNYNAKRATVLVERKGVFVAIMTPEKRYYWTREVVHIESKIYSAGLSHLHVLLTEDEEPYQFGLYHKPLINLLWLGVALMVLGGAISVLNRLKKPNASSNT